MAESGAIRAGRAFVELYADDKALRRGLTRASARLKAFGVGVQAAGMKLFSLGAMAAAPILATAGVFAKMGDNLLDMSKRTGFSVEALSELQYAAEMSGTSLESVEGAVKKMFQSLGEATTGSVEAGEAFTRLGLSVDELGAMSPEQAFMSIAEALSKVPGTGARSAMAMKVFGKSAMDLLPLLEDGSKGIAEFRDEARRFGYTMSEEDAKAAALFDDKITQLRWAIKRAAFTIGAAMAPVLQVVTEKLHAATTAISQFINTHRGLVRSIAAGVAGVMALGGVMTFAGVAIRGVGSAVGLLGPLIGVVAVGFKAVTVALGLMLSPIGLVAAAALSLGAYILHATGAAGKAVSWLGEKFAVLVGDVNKAKEGIVGALTAGDIGLAAKILWLTLKLEWVRGVNAVKAVWEPIKFWARTLFTEVKREVLTVWSSITYGLQYAWNEAVAALKTVWANFTKWYKDSVNWLSDQIAKVYIDLEYKPGAERDAAYKYLENQKNLKTKQIEDEKNASLTSIEAQRKAKEKALGDTLDTELAAIDAAATAEQQKTQAGRDAAAAAAEADLEAARKQFAEAVAAGKAAGVATTRPAGPADPQSPESLRDKAKSALEGLGRAMQTQLRGTYNADIAGQLGQGSTAEKLTAIVKATEKTSYSIAQLLVESRNGGIVFN